LVDPVAIRENDWRAFCRIEALENHWDRPYWLPNRRCYHWFITFERSSALAELSRRCQDQLAQLRLSLVPADGLHLTVARLGFTDQISAHEAQTVANAAREACTAFPAMRLAIGPPAGSPGSIRFSVAPWEGLVDLHGRLRRAAASVLEGWPSEGNRLFRPHVSFAYSNRMEPAAPTIDAVASLRSTPPVGIMIRSVQLVILRRAGRGYRWDTVVSLNLGGQ
jgi:2'-5' RNA ligase